METKKHSRKWIVVTVLLLLIYPIYFCVVQISTKSDSFSLFPSEGVWIAEETGYSIEIDLDQESSPITLSLSNGEKISLEQEVSGGHGTIIYPTSATTILYFTSKGLDSSDSNFVYFSCSKFKFNEDDFYFYNICVYDQSNLSVVTNKTTLHFIKQS